MNPARSESPRPSALGTATCMNTSTDARRHARHRRTITLVSGWRATTSASARATMWVYVTRIPSSFRAAMRAFIARASMSMNP